MNQNTIPCQSLIDNKEKEKITAWTVQKPGIHNAVEYLSKECQIQIHINEL